MICLPAGTISKRNFPDPATACKYITNTVSVQFRGYFQLFQRHIIDKHLLSQTLYTRYMHFLQTVTIQEYTISQCFHCGRQRNPFQFMTTVKRITAKKQYTFRYIHLFKIPAAFECPVANPFKSFGQRYLPQGHTSFQRARFDGMYPFGNDSMLFPAGITLQHTLSYMIIRLHHFPHRLTPFTPRTAAFVSQLPAFSKTVYRRQKSTPALPSALPGFHFCADVLCTVLSPFSFSSYKRPVFLYNSV